MHIERRPDRVVATLDRPEVRNAIDQATIDDLHSLCAELEAEPRILILTGAGGVFASGADIVLPVAGPVGEGSLNQASTTEGTAVIWVDSDGYLQPKNEQFKSLILTSVLKEIQVSVFDTIKSAVEGSFSAEPYVGTLENGGVALAPLHDWESKVDPALVERIDELKEQIISGELKVESPSSN